MARRYDSRTTTFSPEGRLYQVEYALEAINRAGTAVGIRTKNGIILAAEKKILSKLLESSCTSEKLHRIDEHIMVAVAGINADANIILNYARLEARRYQFSYGEAMPIELLVQTVCDHKQGYTQFGGLRPYGVSLLFAGWDIQHGFQLYQSDPSGNYSVWKATSIGSNSQATYSLFKGENFEDITLAEAKKLAIKFLGKSMDGAVTQENIEVSQLIFSENVLVQQSLRKEEVKILCDASR